MLLSFWPIILGDFFTVIFLNGCPLIILHAYFLGRSAKKDPRWLTSYHIFNRNPRIKDYSAFSAENNINLTFSLSLWIKITLRSKLNSRFQTHSKRKNKKWLYFDDIFRWVVISADHVDELKYFFFCLSNMMKESHFVIGPTSSPEIN